MKVTVENGQYEKLVVTFTDSVTVGGVRFVLNSQWRWKKYVEEERGCSPCGKKRKVKKYLIDADVTGRKLDTAIWVDARYLIEETQIRARLDRELWHERRGDDLVNVMGDLVPDHQKQGLPMHDEHGYIQPNENHIPTPPHQKAG